MLGAPATPSLAEAPSPPVPREAAQRVLDYLIFHRSLVGDGDDGAPKLLERYLSLVQGLKDGVHVVIADPFQKATALLFELVMDESFDPWEIDLVRFTQLYLERVKADTGVDFAVAGRLLYMAWSILYLQSQEVLRLREPPPVEPELPTDGVASDDGAGYLSEVDSPEALDVTSAVLESPNAPPLLAMVRHSETRPVSLLELVQAFGEAEEEARRSLRLEELRARLREEQRAPPQVLVHGDLPAEDLTDAWEAAQRHPVGEPFPFLSLWRREQGRDRLVALFLAALFLARERALELRQNELGTSPIELVRLLAARAAAPEG
jgi:segregation and condensation protein A